MILRLFLTLLAVLPAALPSVLPAELRAETPRVAADIGPVHSLVARVMAGVGEPDLVMSPGASPHGYSMRPSEAAALQAADLVVWIGPDLTPWLDRALESLAGDARHLALLEAEGTFRLPVRGSATFDHGDDDEHDGHDHDGHEVEAHRDHEDHDAHDNDAHSEDAHDEDAHSEDAHSEDAHDEDAHDEDAHDEDAHEGHAHHGEHDPHAWLDPENARAWLDLIAAELARIDPDNAQAYADNAAAARAELATLTNELRATLAPVQGAPFLVYHDAYQYFERRFELNAVGAIAISDAMAPGAARMAELRDLVQEKGPACAFHEPQFSPKLVETLAQGTGLDQAELDPIGQALTPGPDLYPNLLRNMAQGIAGCL